MKFLVITNHSDMFWRFRGDLTAELLKRGEVVVSAPFVGHEDDLKAMGCRCIDTELDRRSLNIHKEIRLLRFYRKLISEEKPDVVITYSIKPNIYGGLVCRRLNIPYYANVQGLGSVFQRESYARGASFLYRLAMKKACAVFFENEANAAVFLDRNIIPAEKVKVLNGAGVNLNFYAKQPYPPEENGIHFLYLGRIMHEKGMDEFFEAAVKLKKKYGDRVLLDLVGYFEDDYEEKINELEREHVISFYGFRSDPRPYYAASHCVVLPSYHEGMSNVLLEAAASGRPLIASDIPGCREALTDNKNGFLIPPRDSEGLYQAMERFLSLSQKERASMGEFSRQKMETEFDKRQVVRDTLATLQL